LNGESFRALAIEYRLRDLVLEAPDQCLPTRHTRTIVSFYDTKVNRNVSCSDTAQPRAVAERAHVVDAEPTVAAEGGGCGGWSCDRGVSVMCGLDPRIHLLRNDDRLPGQARQ
jgi:hypothetical protein